MILKTGLSRLLCEWHRLARDRRGVSAVEFAMIAPIFLLLLSGTIELGGMMHTRFQLNSAVSAAATYSVLNGSTLTATTAPTLATNASAIVAGNSNSSVAVTVTINNGYTRTLTNGQSTTTGNASEADKCYCPTRSGTTITWGSAMTCQASCSNGSIAGKFVAVTASRSYEPMFSGYNLVEAGQISVITRAQVN